MRISRSGEALKISMFRKQVTLRSEDIVGVEIRSEPIHQLSRLLAALFKPRPHLFWIRLTTESQWYIISRYKAGFSIALEWLKENGWSLDEAAPRSLQHPYLWIALTRAPPRAAGRTASADASSPSP